MSNIPNLGEYGYITPVADLKKVVSGQTSNAKNESKHSVVSNPKPTNPISEPQKKKIVRPEKVKQSEVTNEQDIDSKDEIKPSKNYLKYPLIGLLFLLSGFLAYYLLSKFKNEKKHVPAISAGEASTNVSSCPPIPTEIEIVNRSNFNPFLKNRAGYFPNSPYYRG